jgi:hypothetical protein
VCEQIGDFLLRSYAAHAALVPGCGVDLRADRVPLHVLLHRLFHVRDPPGSSSTPGHVLFYVRDTTYIHLFMYVTPRICIQLAPLVPGCGVDLRADRVPLQLLHRIFDVRDSQNTSFTCT